MNTIHWLAAALCAAAAAANAQAGKDEPLYRSALDGYRSWRADEQLADWKRANDEMKGLGGHAGHLRGAPRAPGSKPVPAKPLQQDKPAAAGGHGAHHGAQK